jgi:hypothetical protein
VRIMRGAVLFPRQRNGIANEGAGLAGGAQGDAAGLLVVVIDPLGHQAAGGEVAIIVVVNRLHRRAVALPAPMQVAERLLLLRVNTQHGDALGPGLPAQGVDVTKLLVALRWIDRAGDQLLAEGAAPIAGPLQERRGGVAADGKATREQLLRQLQGLEIRPAHGRIGGAAGAVGFQNLLHRLLQPRLAFARLGAAATAADALGIAARAARVVGVVLAHVLQLADAGVEGAAAHPQDARDIGDAPKADLQRLQRGVAAPVVLRQRAGVDAHELFVRLIVAWKLVHTFHRGQTRVAHPPMNTPPSQVATELFGCVTLR